MNRLRFEVRRSWLSLVSAVPAIAGYLLLGHDYHIGWLLLAAGNIGLVVVGLTKRQWGLLIGVLPVGIAINNYIS
jgi:hypothetical protein